jgi:hypothetical protein
MGFAALLAKPANKSAVAKRETAASCETKNASTLSVIAEQLAGVIMKPCWNHNDGAKT